MDLKTLIRDIPDFPQPGIIFRDITTLLKDAEGLQNVMQQLVTKCQELDIKPEYIIGIESRGFIFAPVLAYEMGAGFIPVRKKGKLPAPVYSIEYALEYGTDTLEIHQDALPEGALVMIVDDVIATGGTAKATAELVEKIGAKIVAFTFVVELMGLEGTKQLPSAPVISLVKY
ncbi:MAG: adenine phosphoribosyltransferase [Cyanobacterium sp. T60_A2020_053]|nr:adenine phosphoribosyltransferase [Cyanobacterium sp. T60_A2020_053]